MSPNSQKRASPTSGCRSIAARVASIATRGALLERVAVDAGRDRREGDARAAVPGGELDRAAVAGGEQLRLAAAAAVPDRADGVDDVRHREVARRR